MERRTFRLGSTVFSVVSEKPVMFFPEMEQFACNDTSPELELHCDYEGPGVLPNDNLMGSMGLRSQLLSRGAVVLHASYIIYRGGAILFTGSSGVGKSTQAALWEKLRGAEIINGDRALVERTEHGFTANGVFFCGSSGICRNRTAPLAAIVALSRGDNRITPLRGIEVLRLVLSQCAYDADKTDDVMNITALLADLAAQVPMFLLEASPDEGAVLALEQALKGIL